MTSYAFADLITFTRATTATYVNSSGNIATAASGSPRFDYDPVTLSPRGFRVEEQRTNLRTYSEQFNNAAWAKDSCTISADAAVSPDGAKTADKVVSNSATAQTGIGQPFTSTGAVYTSSFYVKADGAQFVQLLWSGTASTEYANFDLSAGTVVQSTGTATIIAAGNGWYRISLTSTLAAVSANAFCWMVNSGTATRAAAYTGNGTNGFLVWGAQLEVGSFPSSYIPTVASQVTRAAEVPVIQSPNFAPWYNSTEGTFVIEYSLLSATYATTKHVLTFSDGTGNNRISVYNAATTATPFLLVADSGVTQASAANAAIGSNVVAKTGVGYKVNDFALITNGGTAATDTSGTVPAAVNRVYIAGSATGAQPINGHIRTVRYYASRLTNAQLQALTV